MKVQKKDGVFLKWVVYCRTVVNAIHDAVSIVIIIRSFTTAFSGRCFVRIAWTIISAILNAIAVSIRTTIKFGQAGFVGAFVIFIWDTIAVRIRTTIKFS